MGNGRSLNRIGCSVRRRSWSASIPIMDVLRKSIGSFPKKLRDHALGNLRQVKYLLAILAVIDGHSLAQIALVLRVHEQTVAAWVNACCCYGVQGVPRQKPTGRPPKLTSPQQAALAALMDEGPGQAGCSGACWRSPRIQELIYDRFGGFYNVFYIAQL